MDVDKAMIAFSMLFTNMAGKYVRDDIDAIGKALLHDELAKKLFWICLVFIATRDLMLSIMFGFIMAVVAEICDHSKRFFLFEQDAQKVSQYSLRKSTLATSMSMSMYMS